MLAHMRHRLRISPHWLVDQHISRTERHTTRLSPAQVVVGCLHVVELTTCQCPQLIERHSWGKKIEHINKLAYYWI